MLSVTNSVRASGGEDVETDDIYRGRALAETQVGRSSSVNAIIQAVREVPNVSRVLVFENKGESVDEAGLGPRSIHVVVVGGIEQAIAEAIFQQTAVTVRYTGDIERTVTATNGQEFIVKFSRPQERTLFVNVNLVINSDYVDTTDTIRLSLIHI